MAARAFLVAVLVAGCAPQLLAVKDTSSADGVSVVFCGSERLKTERAGGTGWMPGRGFLFMGSTSEDSGQSDICITVANESDGVVDVDRRRIRLVGDGYRGRTLRDGQDRTWRIRPGQSEDIHVTFVTDSFARGEELLVSFKGAVLLDGGAVRLPPLHLTYR